MRCFVCFRCRSCVQFDLIVASNVCPLKILRLLCPAYYHLPAPKNSQTVRSGRRVRLSKVYMSSVYLPVTSASLFSQTVCNRLFSHLPCVSLLSHSNRRLGNQQNARRWSPNAGLRIDALPASSSSTEQTPAFYAKNINKNIFSRARVASTREFIVVIADECVREISRCPRPSRVRTLYIHITTMVVRVCGERACMQHIHCTHVASIHVRVWCAHVPNKTMVARVRFAAAQPMMMVHVHGLPAVFFCARMCVCVCECVRACVRLIVCGQLFPNGLDG